MKNEERKMKISLHALAELSQCIEARNIKNRYFFRRLSPISVSYLKACKTVSFVETKSFKL